MKSLIISLVIAALIVAGSVVYGSHMDEVSRELTDANDAVTEAIELGDYDAAESTAEGIEEYLEQKRTLLAATDNHEVLDKIEIHLKELLSYIGGRRKADALARCRVLGYLYEQLPKNYEVRLENIL